MTESGKIVKEKSFAFAVRVVKLCNYLVDEKRDFVLSRQLLKSGTSIGANVREAYKGESDADFIHKLGIALKESDESCYWLELLHASNYLDQKGYESIYSEAITVKKIITSIILTKKQNMKR